MTTSQELYDRFCLLMQEHELGVDECIQAYGGPDDDSLFVRETWINCSVIDHMKDLGTAYSITTSGELCLS